jgi:GMP synthase (glutamine-hydrolysing)
MLIFIQNDAEVPAGTYVEELARKRIPFAVVEAFKSKEFPPLSGTSAVIVLGGSMGVHDVENHPFLVKVKKYILEVLNSGKPYLGICLGGQLLADVLNARVSSALCGERGTHSISLTGEGLKDPLFRSVPGLFTTFQWHNDSFALPEAAIRLASSGGCPNQAFRYGNAAYGLQFHPEVNEQIVAAWCGSIDSGNEPVPQIMYAFKCAENPYRTASLRILRNFLDISGVCSYPS